MAAIEVRHRKRLRVRRPVVYATVGFVLLLGAVKISGPVRVARQQAVSLEGMRREKAGLERENAELQGRKTDLATPEGMARYLRGLGYRKPGERAIKPVREKGK